MQQTLIKVNPSSSWSWAWPSSVPPCLYFIFIYTPFWWGWQGRENGEIKNNLPLWSQKNCRTLARQDLRLLFILVVQQGPKYDFPSRFSNFSFDLYLWCIFIYILFWWGWQGGIRGTTNSSAPACFIFFSLKWPPFNNHRVTWGRKISVACQKRGCDFVWSADGLWKLAYPIWWGLKICIYNGN